MADNIKKDSTLFASKSDQIALKRIKTKSIMDTALTIESAFDWFAVTVPTIISICSLSLSGYLFITRRNAYAALAPDAKALLMNFAYAIHSNEALRFTQGPFKRLTNSTNGI